MKTLMTGLLCRALAVALALLPMQAAQADVIGTEQGARVERSLVLGVLDRAEVQRAMQARGLDAQAARDRVAAMTDAEVVALADGLDTLPAGADGGAVLAFLIAVGLLIWYFFEHRPKQK